MTTINPNERYTANECIQHPYFTNNDCYRKKVGGDDDTYIEDGNHNINNNKYNEDIRRDMMNDLLDGFQRVDNYDYDNLYDKLEDDDDDDVVDNDNKHNNDKPCNDDDSFIPNEEEEEEEEDNEEEYGHVLQKWKNKAMQIAKMHRTNNCC